MNTKHLFRAAASAALMSAGLAPAAAAQAPGSLAAAETLRPTAVAEASPNSMATPAPSWSTAGFAPSGLAPLGLAPLGFAPGPSLVGDGSGGLALAGDPGRRLLLLVGDLVAGDELDHRRVAPRRIVELSLPPCGTLFLEGIHVGRRSHLQAYQPPAAGEPLRGGFSIPITLQPPATGSSALLSQGSLASPGDLVVTEFMKDPTAVSDGHGEWIELRVNQSWRLDVEGVTIADFSGASFTLQNGGQGLLLAPGQRYVLGNDADPGTNGGVPVDYGWTGFSLKNSADEILVYDSLGRLLDVVDYDDGVRWPDTPGKSISLGDPVISSMANNDPALWCHGSTALGAGPDTGTPGAVNDVCP